MQGLGLLGADAPSAAGTDYFAQVSPLLAQQPALEPGEGVLKREVAGPPTAAGVYPTAAPAPNPELEAQKREMAKRGVQIKGQAPPPSTDPRDTRTLTPPPTNGGGGGGGSTPTARDVVDQQRASGPVDNSADYSTTNIDYSNMFGKRGPRISPLSVSWRFPFEPQKRGITVIRGGGMSTALMVGVGLLFFGAIIVAIKD
jgi:hypothetical protein